MVVKAASFDYSAAISAWHWTCADMSTACLTVVHYVVENLGTCETTTVASCPFSMYRLGRGLESPLGPGLGWCVLRQLTLTAGTLPHSSAAGLVGPAWGPQWGSVLGELLPDPSLPARPSGPEGARRAGRRGGVALRLMLRAVVAVPLLCLFKADSSDD
jgi:hypothetical protein